MAATGVCGSDLHVLKGEWPRPAPMVLGHEGAGVVEAVGEGVDTLSAGDRVVISWAPACGECTACLAGRPAACEPLRAAIGAGTLLDGTTRLSLGGETVYRMTATTDPGSAGCVADVVLFMVKGWATGQAAERVSPMVAPTTLLLTLLGLTRLKRGRVAFRGEDITRVPTWRRAIPRRRVGLDRS